MEKKRGTFYGIGVGPGDPELITVKALKIIKSSPIIAAPRTGNGDMVALDIVWRTGILSESAEIAEEFDKKNPRHGFSPGQGTRQAERE